ncbi:MAG: VCBS repeat-containing protein [Chloroflexota bacterium]
MTTIVIKLIAILALSILVVDCGQPTPTPTTVIPSATPVVAPTPTATTIATFKPVLPTPTRVLPSPTPVPATPASLPTLSPETVDVREYLPRKAEIVEAVQADVDQDGIPELIVLFMEGEFLRQAKAMVLRQTPAGVAAHYLKGNLGYSAIALTVRDVNKDGRPEIVVGDGPRALYFFLNIYRWQDGSYRAIGEFFGDGGAWLEDLDGDSVFEVLVGNRWHDRSQLREEVTYRWSARADKYLEEEKRLEFAYGVPTPHEYPEQTVLTYYLAIDKGNYSKAYSYLAPSFQATISFDEFRAGFAATRRVNVNKLEVRADYATIATIAVEFTAWDEVHGKLTRQRFSGGWLLEKQAGEWKLMEAGIAPKE